MNRRIRGAMLVIQPLVVLWLVLCTASGPAAAFTDTTAAVPLTATFSIVARDPETEDLGVAVQSKYFAVGAVVPHAQAGVGAIATQARGNLLYASQGFGLLLKGHSPEQVVEALIAADPLRSERQVGVVNRQGRAASYTGEDCLPWAGGRTGENYAVQGNLLAGPQVVDAMAAAFESASGDLAHRLVYALAAGQAAGGDARGRQSAAVLVVRRKGGYMGLTDRYIDLHVEDHATPVRELQRLLRIRHAQLAVAAAERLVRRVRQTTGETRRQLTAQARARTERALALHPHHDHAWWLLAQVRLLANDPEGAGAAARQALLVNPSWRRLPPSTLQKLGIEPQLIAALLKVESFRRLWESLSADSETTL